MRTRTGDSQALSRRWRLQGDARGRSWTESSRPGVFSELERYRESVKDMNTVIYSGHSDLCTEISELQSYTYTYGVEVERSARGEKCSVKRRVRSR